MDVSNLPCRDESGAVNVVVEAPRGSLVKLKWMPERGAFYFHRALPLGFAYPYDWGFVPSTRAEDGDPLDAMVVFDAPTWPGVVIPARPIGVVRLRQREKTAGELVRNDRIIAVPRGDERWKDVADFSTRMKTQLEHFFVIVGELTHAKVRVDGWKGANAAMKLVDRAANRYVRRGPES